MLLRQWERDHLLGMQMQMSFHTSRSQRQHCPILKGPVPRPRVYWNFGWDYHTKNSAVEKNGWISLLGTQGLIIDALDMAWIWLEFGGNKVYESERGSANITIETPVARTNCGPNCEFASVEAQKLVLKENRRTINCQFKTWRLGRSLTDEVGPLFPSYIWRCWASRWAPYIHYTYKFRLSCAMQEEKRGDRESSTTNVLLLNP